MLLLISHWRPVLQLAVVKHCLQAPFTQAGLVAGQSASALLVAHSSWHVPLLHIFPKSHPSEPKHTSHFPVKGWQKRLNDDWSHSR